MLGDKDRIKYLEDGFLVVRSFIKESHLSVLRKEADHLFNWSESDITLDLGCIVQPVNSSELLDPSSALEYASKRIEVSDEVQTVFDLLSGDLPMTASQLLPVNIQILLFNEQYIIKAPNLGNSTEFPWHRDGDYLRKIVSTFPFISCWICLDTTDQYNGALEVIPYAKCHKPSLDLFYDTQKYAEWHRTVSGYSKSQTVITQTRSPQPIYTNAGDVVFISPMLLHRSGPNKSNKFRRAYMPQFSSYQIIAHNTHPISLTIDTNSLILGFEQARARSY